MLEKGLLRDRIDAARKILQACNLCPRKCRIDRLAGQTGVCKTAERAWISSYNAHFGEEAPLVGTNGSGTIFFTHCNLMCIFCQNFDISHEGYGQEATADQLAAVIAASIRQVCNLRGEVLIVPAGTLANDGKVIDDLRPVNV